MEGKAEGEEEEEEQKGRGGRKGGEETSYSPINAAAAMSAA